MTVTESIWAGRQQRATLIGVCIACAMVPLDITILGVAVDSIGRELKADFTQIEWIVNTHNLTFGSFLLTGGSLADRFGRRQMLCIGLCIFVILSLLYAFAKSALTLSLLRAAQGIGAAFLFSSATAVLANEFRGSSRPAAFGMLGSSLGVGLVLGPLLGGLLTSTVGWRWAFLINLPVGLAMLLLAVPRMRESRDSKASYVDWWGLVTFTISLFLLILGLIEAPRIGWISAIVICSLIGFVVFIGLFFVVERIQRRGMFDLTLLHNPVFVGMLLLPIALGFGYVALLIYLPIYFQGIGGYTPWQAGLVMMPLNLPVFIMPTISARLSLFVQPRKLLALGFVCVGLGNLLMRPAIGSTDWKTFLGSLIVVGIGAGIVNGIMDSVAVSVAPPERSGMATGIFNTMRPVGNAIGFAGAGAILVSVIQVVLPRLVSGKLNTFGTSFVANVEQVARGDISGAVALVPPTVQLAFRDVATRSYTEALQAVLIVQAAICFIAAILVFRLCRKK